MKKSLWDFFHNGGSAIEKLEKDKKPWKNHCRADVGQIISWNMNARFFPKELQDKNIRLKYFKNIVEDVGLDDLVMPDQPNSDKLIEDCH